MVESDTEREERAALEQSIAALRTELRALPLTQANSMAIQRLHRSLTDIEGQIADVDVGYPSAVFIAPILRVIHRVELPDPDDVLATLEQFGLYDPAQESIWVVTFDAVLQLRKIAEVARGSYSSVDAPIAAVLSGALLSATDRFWLVHNHPSGLVEPSDADVDLTAKLMNASNVCGLRFEDHLIIGPPDHVFSFRSNGLIRTADNDGPTDAYGLSGSARRTGRRKPPVPLPATSDPVRPWREGV